MTTVPLSLPTSDAEYLDLVHQAFDPENQFDDVRAMQLADVSWYLPDDILVKVDRATMAVGLEAREPLLDHRLFAYAATLPTSTLISHELGGKHILKDILSSYVPATMFDRPKAGFSLPIADWLRGGLREWASDFLTMRHMDDIGIKDSAQIMSIWQQHLRGDIDAQDTLWPVLSLLSWKHQRI